ncbi:MAG: efflux RND transporter periplasmic adaptor subunit [Proteobacteria bacterium]|nr:efflux RND transporter periplasmic adaptor subunit [Pseudomonadota bacterium]
MRSLSLIGIGLVLIAGCKKPPDATAQKKPPPAPVKIETIIATESSTPEILTLTGLVAPDQRSEVTADTQGKVIAVMVDRGQRVKMGEAVVRLDVRNAALSAREANANLENARAQKALAEQECTRAKALFDKGAITRSEFDRQSTQCTSALQQVSAAQARTEMIAKSVTDGVVRAPFDGEVAEKMVAPGEWVAPGRALFTLVDDSPLHVELSVPEIAVAAISEKQRVTLTAVGRPGVQYNATITRVGAEIGRTRSLIVEATIDAGPPVVLHVATAEAAKPEPVKPEPMKAGSGSGSGSATKPPTPPTTPTSMNPLQQPLVPGMFAEARVVVGQKLRPVLPASAVKLSGRTWHAYVVIKGEVVERIVQLGPEPEPGKVSIGIGIEPGERVVATITDQIIDGLRVVE